MRALAKEDLWETAECPAPDYCATLAWGGFESCQKLTDITDPKVLSAHLRQDGTRNQLHAAANPSLAAEDRAGALTIEDKLFQENGAGRNPSMRREDFPAIEEWDYPILKGFAARNDIFTEEDFEYFFGQPTRSADCLVLMAGQLSPKIEQMLLDRAGSLPMKESWARRDRASSGYLVGCLNLSLGPNDHKYDLQDLWVMAAKNPNLPVEAIFTIPLKDELTESALLENAEGRPDETRAWIEENYPELKDVPFSWVRETLSE